jgi:hypothetical protein
VKRLLLTLATRGDGQPLVALARGLANAGHEAVLAAPHRFEGLVRDQGGPFVGIDDCWSVTAEGAGCRRGHPGAQRSGGRRPACRGVAGDRGRAGVADPHGGADSRGSLGGQSDIALVALGAAPGHRSRGEGPGDDVRPHPRQVARGWTCRDAVAGMICAAAPTAHRRRCCTRSADLCCHGRRWRAAGAGGHLAPHGSPGCPWSELVCRLSRAAWCRPVRHRAGHGGRLPSRWRLGDGLSGPAAAHSAVRHQGGVTVLELGITVRPGDGPLPVRPVRTTWGR